MTFALGGRELVDSSSDERRVMARSMAYLAAAAGTLMLVTLLLPHGEGAHGPGLVAIAGAAYASAAVGLAVRSLSVRSFDAILAFATVMICATVVLGGSIVGEYDLFLVWLALLAFYFRPWTDAARLLAFMVVAYAASLFVGRPSGEVVGARSAMLVGTLFATAAFVGLLKARVDRLMAGLSEAARHDAVTGLLNRRGFDEAYEPELERARRSGRPLSLLVADLDHLKEINDRFGHHAGDAALEQVGAAIIGVARRIDSVARVGGDEFAVLLPETDADGALVIGERLCAAVRAAGIAAGTQLTMSVGAATYAGDERDAETVLRQADDAAYTAKRLGRDQAVTFSAGSTATHVAVETGPADAASTGAAHWPFVAGRGPAPTASPPRSRRKTIMRPFVGRALVQHLADDGPLVARSAGYLWASGGTLMLVTVLISRQQTGHDDQTTDLALLAIAGSAYVVALAAVVARSISGPAIEVLLVLATVAICFALVLSGSTSSEYDLYLVWVTLWAFSFLPWVRAAPQLVFVVVAYAASLFVVRPSGDVVGARSAMLVGTLLATAAFVGLLKARVDRLVLALSEAARHDSVTGLLNRRGFEEAYQGELDRARRSGRPLSLLVADLDHLKEINDRFGHQAGDRALEQVGAALTVVTRRIDSVARTGGDEFAVLLPDTDARGARVMAERLCAAVRTASVAGRPLTLSVGGATYADAGRDDEELVRQADEAAYAAKRLGRDRAVLFSGGEPATS